MFLLRLGVPQSKAKNAKAGSKKNRIRAASVPYISRLSGSCAKTSELHVRYTNTRLKLVDLPPNTGKARMDKNGNGSATKLVTLDIAIPYNSGMLLGSRTLLPWKYP